MSYFSSSHRKYKFLFLEISHYVINYLAYTVIYLTAKTFCICCTGKNNCTFCSAPIYAVFQYCFVFLCKCFTSDLLILACLKLVFCSNSQLRWTRTCHSFNNLSNENGLTHSRSHSCSWTEILEGIKKRTSHMNNCDIYKSLSSITW